MFTRFKLHYRFEAHFCNGGKGNEKGHIENKIGYVRRNWVLPYPEVTSFEELADELYHRAIEDLNRSHYQKESRLEELWEADKQVLLALPAIPFEPAQTDTARVD
ncbi:MAG: IS21 family transposase, partial [bacterium]